MTEKLYTPEEYAAAKEAELVERGKPNALTAQEVTWADKTGMSAEEYAAYKGVGTYDDHRKAKARPYSERELSSLLGEGAA